MGVPAPGANVSSHSSSPFMPCCLMPARVTCVSPGMGCLPVHRLVPASNSRMLLCAVCMLRSGGRARDHMRWRPHLAPARPQYRQETTGRLQGEVRESGHLTCATDRLDLLTGVVWCVAARGQRRRRQKRRSVPASCRAAARSLLQPSTRWITFVDVCALLDACSAWQEGGERFDNSARPHVPPAPHRHPNDKCRGCKEQGPHRNCASAATTAPEP